MIAIRTKSVKFHIFLFSVLNEPFPKKQLNIEKDKTKQVNENFKALQNYNKSLIVMVKSSEQNALIYKSISDSKSKTIETLSEKLKEAEESNKNLKKAHDNLVSRKENLTTVVSSSSLLKRKSIGVSHSPSKIAKTSAHSNEPLPKKQLNIEKDKTKQAKENFKALQNNTKSLIEMMESSEQKALIYKREHKISAHSNGPRTPSLRIKDIKTLLVTTTEEYDVVPENTNLDYDDIAEIDEETNSKITKDLDQLKKEVSKIVKSFLNKKSVKLSKKEIDCLTYEFRKNIKRNHLESNGSYKDVAVDDVTKVKIKEKIKLYIKIQQEVKNILGNFFLEANSESQIQKFSWEFYKQIRATYDEIPPGLKGGMMVGDEERMTLTEDFSKQMSDSITFQMTRNKRS